MGSAGNGVPCGALHGADGAVVCVLPAGHEGPHASERPCDHRDETGAMTLYYLHEGARCTQCGAFVV